MTVFKSPRGRFPRRRAKAACRSPPQGELDGKRYIDVADDHISGAGAVGVWTKADSVTLFDTFSFGTGGTK
ncbi:hypothetical protein [Cupriavidus sp. 8B]